MFLAGIDVPRWLIRRAVAAVFAATATFASPARGLAFDSFLRIDGIEGDSTTKGEEGSIQILSQSWAIAQDLSSCSPGSPGGCSFKVECSPFTFSKFLDRASIPLFIAVATGKHYGKAVLVLRRSGSEKMEVVVKYTLEDVTVTSYSMGGSSGGMPSESFTLNFARIQSVFNVLEEGGGTPPGKVLGGYDCQLNKQL